MSLFRKKSRESPPFSGSGSSQDQPHAAPSLPTTGSPDTLPPLDLDKIMLLMTRFERSVGTTNDAIFGALREFAVAGGAPEIETYVALSAAGRDTGIDRPWRWLARAAQEAQVVKRVDLVSHIAIFASFWKMNLEPTWRRGEWVDTLLQRISDESLTCLANVILPTLDKLDPGLVIMRHPTGDIDVQGMLNAWSLLATQNGTADLSFDARRIVEKVLS